MKQSFIVFAALLLMISLSMGQGYQEPLKVGEDAPEISVLLDENQQFLLSQELEKADHVIMVFYRGSWCGYCQKHMSDLQDSLAMILETNTSVIVVTPETNESIEKMKGNAKTTFNIVHDKDYTIMKDYHVDYQISEETVPKYLGPVTKRTATANGNDEGVLPVPATYIINKKQQIEWVHFDVKYSERSTIKEMLEVIKK